MSTVVHAQDPFGNAVTLQHPASAAAVAGFVDGFLGYQPSNLAILPAAETDHSLIVQTCAAVLWMFSESPAGPPKARWHLARAAAAAWPATERERQFAAAVAHWVAERVKQLTRTQEETDGTNSETVPRHKRGAAAPYTPRGHQAPFV